MEELEAAAQAEEEEEEQEEEQGEEEEGAVAAEPAGPEGMEVGGRGTEKGVALTRAASAAD